MTNLGNTLIKRGDIYWIRLDPVVGHEQKGRRPVLVIQNDIGNRFLSTTIIAPVTSKVFNVEYPTNITLPKKVAGLKSDSTVLLHQIKTVDKQRFEKKIGCLPEIYMEKVHEAIKVSLGL